MSTKHSKSAARFLENRESARWHDETLWMVRHKRDVQRDTIPEWEQLRSLAHDLKRYSVTHLEELLQQFEEQASRNGVVVHWAKDAAEHNQIVHDILHKHGVKKLVKSKSMLSEECHLNDYLIDKGIRVIETDLGERILQLMNIPPSHIVITKNGVRKKGTTTPPT